MIKGTHSQNDILLYCLASILFLAVTACQTQKPIATSAGKGEPTFANQIPTAYVIPIVTLQPTATALGIGELPFETIEKSESSGTGYGFRGVEPDIAVVFDKDSIPQLTNTISPQALSSLQEVDFRKYYVLVVYQGIKPTTNYGVEIQHIIMQEDTITIDARFTERDPAMWAGDIVTSPYHLVRVPRQGSHGWIKFILTRDGIELLHQTYYGG